MYEYFQDRDINSNLKKLKEIFNIISLTSKYKVIGSSSLKNIRYNSDFDLADFYNNKQVNIKRIVRYFQSIYKKLNSNNSYSYITDFKCGLNSDDTPLKWTKKEVLNNKKLLISGDFITLDEAIQQKSVIKIDVISYINNRFIEISENYYIKLNGKSNYDESELTDSIILKSLKQDELNEVKDDNYNKALKRKFSYLFLKNKNDPKLKQLEQFFNSDIGILNKTRSDLDVLILLLEKVKDINIDQILNAVDSITFQNSYNLIKDFTNDFNKIEQVRSRKTLYKLLVQLRNKIYIIVNTESKKFYKK